MKTIIFQETTTKTLRELLYDMEDGTIMYIPYVSNTGDWSSLQSLGFSAYASLTLTKLSSWSEKVEIVSVKGSKLGYWVGSANETIIGNIKTYG